MKKKFKLKNLNSIKKATLNKLYPPPPTNNSILIFTLLNLFKINIVNNNTKL